MFEFEYEAFFYCILNDFNCLIKAVSKITDEFFFDYKAQRLFKEIIACQLENDRVDWSILYAWLKRSDAMSIVTAEYMLAISDYGSKLDIANFDQHLNAIIKGRKTSLTVQMLQNKYKSLCNDGNSIDEELNALRNDIDAIESQCSTVSIECTDIDAVLDQVERDKIKGVQIFDWEYKPIQANSGIEPGCLYAVAGRPGTGKTTFAMNVMTRTRQKTAIISYEMSKKELIERFCQIQNKHNRRFYDMSMLEIRQQGERLKASGIQIFDCRGKNELVIRDIMDTGEFDYAFIDHLQAIPCSKSFGVAERLKFNYLMEFIDRTRTATGKGAIILSQVNRDVDNRRPLLRDMKETAVIEELCQMVMFLYERRDLMLEAEGGTRIVEAIIEKSRFGPKTNKDDILLDFNTNTMNFYEKVR